MATVDRGAIKIEIYTKYPLRTTLTNRRISILVARGQVAEGFHQIFDVYK